MRKHITLTCAAFALVMPSFAFAQTSPGASPSATGMPSAEQSKTPAVGTPSSAGRSSSTMPSSDPSKPDTDGLHPSGQKLNNSAK